MMAKVGDGMSPIRHRRSWVRRPERPNVKVVHAFAARDEVVRRSLSEHDYKGLATVELPPAPIVPEEAPVISNGYLSEALEVNPTDPLKRT